MREITFRGKRIDNGKFIEGDLINLDHHTLIATKDMWASNLHDNYSTTKTLELEVLPVIKESIGQFTGLTDKNGTKVFEGDIVLYHGAKGEVYYCNDTCMFMAKFNITNSAWSFDSMDDEIEVVGNIYEI